MKQKKTIFYLGIAGLFLLFAFTDLQISKALYNPQSLLGRTFEMIGETPMIIVGVCSGVAMILTYTKRNTMMDWFHNLGFSLLTLMTAVMGVFMMRLYLNLPWFVELGLVALYIMLAIFFVRKVSKEFYPQLRQIGKMGIILSFLAVFVVTLIKMVWGRERFRNMSAPYETFTPWYLIQGFTTNNEFMSFPSGHAANSSLIYMVTLLPPVVPRLIKYTKTLRSFAIIWFVLVMISRVVMGAHFASDVTMGMTLSLTLFWLLKDRFIDKKEINYETKTVSQSKIMD